MNNILLTILGISIIISIVKLFSIFYGCKHSYEEVGSVRIYFNDTTDENDFSHSRVTFLCKKCGKFKKIKI